ncbi:3-hydroxyisobutyrate dehydrogenase/2-hydroxy-3-oxopropionate reductase [Sinobacterium caligoides]|uniref:3-hydroxyisobutyrate dehydrogenase/2-hydroxy-3-oxopropionate reductase n=1 Tax=Sinobacterium caligoides TaxID=933926 RepID=A0A3N2DGI0_9GAMM|nr:NAD(P)-dependent oxidoreductase [Sinobacterium caligoides]ROR98903.1 3-hydroxyisobutyrate dehydrogenase/2-hydroxy-3-oxopropionate reductase [Sinobacterium caligoides]
MKVAFIGLGVMGYPMAGHLQRAGLAVTVYNRTIAKAQAWVAEYGGAFAETPAAAAATADIVLMCVGNDDDLRAVSLGSDGAVAAMRQGTLLVDHTTASAEIARELHASCAAAGIGFLDAPVSGGEQGALNGQLTIMCGGDESAFTEARSVLDIYAKQLRWMGPAGSGQLTKMVNQICIAGLLQGLSEALNFATRAGLDVEEVVAAISQGAAQSWQMDNRHATMAAGSYEHGFAVDWMRKDLAICLGEAERNGASLPVTALVDQFYKEVQQMGGSRWDTSSLLARLDK